MRRYYKEIVSGLLIPAVVFVLFLRADLFPFVLVAVIAFVFVYAARKKGFLTVNNDNKASRRSPAYMTFDEIGGQDLAKKELIEALDFLIRQDEIREFGIRPLKGILLTGPPGTGKTLMAKAAAHYTDSVFAAASGSEFIEMYVGVGAGRIRDLFKDARKRAANENKKSAIVFIDEIDVIGGKRDGSAGHREYDQTLNQLLTEMDGIHSSDSLRLLVVAATNRKEMLDSALLRPGRFDRHIQVDLPDKKGRLQILQLHAHNKPLDSKVSLDKVAEETFGFSGAQLESVLNEAAIYAMRDEAERIEPQHISFAIDKVMMGEKTDRETTNEEKRRVALHELGHAIVAELVRPGSVSQVSLSPRGQALGYVRHNPQQDQYLYTKAFLEEQLMICLGGAAAEEMFYGGRSTGSRGDFDQALNIVGTMIESGLTSLGIVSVDMVTPDELMKENKAILDEIAERTRQVLGPYRDVFMRSLDILLREEVLSGDEFRQLLDKVKREATALA